MVEKIIRVSKRKKKYLNDSKKEKFIEKKREEHSKEYFLPKYVLNENIKEEKYGNMKVYVFNYKSTQDKSILYFHGGGYVYSPNYFEYKLIERIALETNLKIIMPIYPKVPIANAKETYDLILHFYKDTLLNNEIIFLGDSAGGGLALGFAMELARLEIKGPKDIFLLSPWIDISMKNEESIKYEKVDPMLVIHELVEVGKIWRNDLAENDYRVSPIYGDLTKIGKIHLYIGTREILYPDVVKLAKKLDDLKIDYDLVIGEKMNHVWLSYPIKEGKDETKILISKILNC